MQDDGFKPLHIGTLRLPIGWSLIAAALAITLTSVFHWVGDTNKETVKFGATMLAFAAALVGTVYLGKRFREIVIQRQESLRSSRVATAFQFGRRWNDPRFSEIKSRWRHLIKEELAGKSPQEIRQILLADKANWDATVEIFNFFEELSASIRLQLADEQTAHKLFRGLVLGFYRPMNQWIQSRRDKPTNSFLWKEFEWLYRRWDQTNEPWKDPL